jgi:hypothetical protein
MKITLLIIVVAAVAAGLWQNGELNRIEAHEASLRARLGNVSLPVEIPGGSSIPTKSAHREGRASLDVEALVKMLGRMAGSERASDKERILIQDTLTSASPRELKRLVEELRQSSLPTELKQWMFVPLASRLVESDPKLAMELALEGGEGKTFRMVMRKWLLQDPKGAAAWMHEAATGDSPLDVSRFRGEFNNIDLKSLALAARLAADPAGHDLTELFQTKDLLPAFDEISSTLRPDGLITVVKRISTESTLSDDNRLCFLGGILAHHQDPVQARQILLDSALPPQQFRKAAAILVLRQDPVGIRSGIEWFRGATKGETTEVGLNEIVTLWAKQDPRSAGQWVEDLPDAVEKEKFRAVLKGTPNP